MATGQLTRLVHHLRRAALLRDGAGLTDAELLGMFLSQRDDAAFEALVRRHGPMVMGVCRRILSNLADAEDAFQATFVVLVRKASSVVPRATVGNWLYGVAYRTALAARRAKVRRASKEKKVRDMPHPEAGPEASWQDLQPFLDQELSNLPDKYRVPVVLCDLEGRTRKDVARTLGIPDGTLSNRLATARKLLAKRLARHGLTLSAAAIGTLLACQAASACVAASFAGTTVKAATFIAAGERAIIISAKVAALAQGVLKAMLLTKLKMPAVLLVLGGMVAAGGGVLHHLVAAPEQAGTFKTAKAGNISIVAFEAPQKEFPKQTPDAIPSKEQILDYLNDNARRVESLRSTDVDLTCTQGIKSFGLRGRMVAQAPRNFRLSAKTLGHPVIDIGSNDEEFWCWISKSDPPHQIYCSHKDLYEGRGRQVPFPFQPEWVMQAIGLGSQRPPEKYKLERDGDTLRLVEKSTSPQGKPLRNIIVLTRQAVQPPSPQVIAHLLLDDASGQEVCSAHIKKTQLDRHSGAILPSWIEFRCNVANQTLRLVMKLDGLSVNGEIAPKTFKRRTPEGVRAHNIATEPSAKDE